MRASRNSRSSEPPRETPKPCDFHGAIDGTKGRVGRLMLHRNGSPRELEERLRRPVRRVQDLRGPFRCVAGGKRLSGVQVHNVIRDRVLIFGMELIQFHLVMPFDLSNLTTAELLRPSRGVLAELRQRGVPRTATRQPVITRSI